MGAVISTLRGIFFFWRGTQTRQETSPLHDADPPANTPEKGQNVVEGAVAKFSELKDGEYVYRKPDADSDSLCQNIRSENRGGMVALTFCPILGCASAPWARARFWSSVTRIKCTLSDTNALTTEPR
jgi:hypothetical protein